MAGMIIGERGEERLRKNACAVTISGLCREAACERVTMNWFDKRSPNSCPLGASEYVLI